MPLAAFSRTVGPNDGPAHGGVGGVKGGAPSVSPALSQSQHPAIHLPYAGRGTDDGDADDVAPPAATGTTLAALSKLQSSVTGKGSCGLVGEQHGAVARLRDARVQWWVATTIKIHQAVDGGRRTIARVYHC